MFLRLLAAFLLFVGLTHVLVHFDMMRRVMYNFTAFGAPLGLTLGLILAAVMAGFIASKVKG